MNKEQFIQIARKAGIAKHGLGWTCWESQLERFFELAILAERELCAQAAVDAIAFNGGSVQIESHVRKAIIEREIEAAHGIKENT